MIYNHEIAVCKFNANYYETADVITQFYTYSHIGL
jgi:hypothetical protein